MKKELLQDLALWMKRHLETLHARENKRSYPDTNVKADGYSVVEIPDWEMRQKLEAVEQALKTADIPPCPYCAERDQHEAEADDGMRNAAEIAGLM